MMNQDGGLSPEGEEFRVAMLQIMQTDVMPLLDKHNTEFIENQIAAAVKKIEAQLQPLFDKIGERFLALEASKGITLAQATTQPETVADRAFNTVNIGKAFADALISSAKEILPLWTQYSTAKYTHGLTSEVIAEMRQKDPVRATVLAQMLNPDPMLNQLPAYTYNVLGMGVQAGLRMKQAAGGVPSLPSGSPSSTSVPGSPSSTPLPGLVPTQTPQSGASMSASDERQLINEALSRAKKRIGSGRA